MPVWEELADITTAPTPEHFTTTTAGTIVTFGEDITEEEATQRRDSPPPLQKSARLTARIAIGIAIGLWTWIVDTGAKLESGWSGWGKYEHYRIGFSLNPFCAYAFGYLRNRNLHGSNVRICDYCPYKKLFGRPCNDRGTHYDLWCTAVGSKYLGKKNHAQAFLEELLQLQKAIILNPKSVLPGSQQ